MGASRVRRHVRDASQGVPSDDGEGAEHRVAREEVEAEPPPERPAHARGGALPSPDEPVGRTGDVERALVEDRRDEQQRQQRQQQREGEVDHAVGIRAEGFGVGRRDAVLQIPSGQPPDREGDVGGGRAPLQLAHALDIVQTR